MSDHGITATFFAALDARYDPTNSDNLPKSTRYLGAANLKKVEANSNYPEIAFIQE